MLYLILICCSGAVISRVPIEALIETRLDLGAQSSMLAVAGRVLLSFLNPPKLQCMPIFDVEVPLKSGAGRLLYR